MKSNMVMFNVIRDLLAEEYYIFQEDGKIIYEGFKLPEFAGDFLVIGIQGGCCEFGDYIVFEGRRVFCNDSM